MYVVNVDGKVPSNGDLSWRGIDQLEYSCERQTTLTGSTFHSPAGTYESGEIDFGTEEAQPDWLRGWSKDRKSDKGYTITGQWDLSNPRKLAEHSLQFEPDSNR